MLRIELWNYDNGHNIPSIVQGDILKVRQNLHDIMKRVATKMPGWKYLLRHEPAICTENEEKQIRIFNHRKDVCPNIDFRDTHSSKNMRLTIEEWKVFAKAIQPEIKEITLAYPGISYIVDITTFSDDEDATENS